jgi:2-iminoacetate synthase
MFADVYPAAVATPSPLLRRFARFLEPKTDAELEAMAREAHRLTLAHFGRTMRLFAPIYLSNECVNACKYCGFSRGNPILRVTLSVEEMRREAEFLVAQGFRSLLLVAGEHPKFVPVSYLAECIRTLAPIVPGIHVEVAPMSTENYRPLVEAGAEGLVVFQETYDRASYAELHPMGPKKNFAWRLNTPERAYAAGFCRLGIGALYGLWEWRSEALASAAHLEHLQRHCWKAQLTTCFPRLRPAAGCFTPRYELADREYVQLVCATRICFPQVGIVVSTRENAAFRDALIPLGVTMMSAGSHTEPGGYTGQGKSALHKTVNGRRLFDETGKAGEFPPPATSSAPASASATEAEGQIEISDPRTAGEMAQRLRELGYDPVWKDWDAAILSGAV